MTSTFPLFDEQGQGEIRNSNEFLDDVHRFAADSLYPVQRYSKTYNNIIEEKANALLMDEETMNFYIYNMNIKP